MTYARTREIIAWRVALPLYLALGCSHGDAGDVVDAGDAGDAGGAGDAAIALPFEGPVEVTARFEIADGPSARPAPITDHRFTLVLDGDAIVVGSEGYSTRARIAPGNRITTTESFTLTAPSTYSSPCGDLPSFAYDQFTLARTGTGCAGSASGHVTAVVDGDIVATRSFTATLSCASDARAPSLSPRPNATGPQGTGQALDPLDTFTWYATEPLPRSQEAPTLEAAGEPARTLLVLPAAGEHAPTPFFTSLALPQMVLWPGTSYTVRLHQALRDFAGNLGAINPPTITVQAVALLDDPGFEGSSDVAGSTGYGGVLVTSPAAPLIDGQRALLLQSGTVFHARISVPPGATHLHFAWRQIKPDNVYTLDYLDSMVVRLATRAGALSYEIFFRPADYSSVASEPITYQAPGRPLLETAQALPIVRQAVPLPSRSTDELLVSIYPSDRQRRGQCGGLSPSPPTILLDDIAIR